MTLLELSALMDLHPLPVLTYFTGLPALAWSVTYYRGGKPLQQSPLRWLYSVILYGVCVPGIIAAVVLADGLAHGELMQVSLYSGLLPLLSMLLILALFRQLHSPEAIPGFRRLTGFIWLLILTAIALYLLMRTRIWIIFGGGIGTLLILMTLLFLALKWAFDRAFGERR